MPNCASCRATLCFAHRFWRLRFHSAAKPVSIRECFREVIARLQKTERRYRPLLNHLCSTTDIFRLKTACDASIIEIECFDHLIIPAAEVALVSRWIRIKLPVVRFDLYASKNNGSASVIRT